MLNLTKNCIQWIKDYFESSGAKTAIVGISGGKDSTIAAALCVEALGADNVIGVLMPQGHQKDIDDSYKVVSILNIQYHVVNIGSACEALYKAIGDSVFMTNGKNAVESNTVIMTNAPARMRMNTLYAIAALYPNARVVNTSNLSEIYVGYSTKWGDGAGDFGPLRDMTVREVLLVGADLGLPEDLIYKVPSDGMSGKTDEENLGLTYDQIDTYLLYVDQTPDYIETKIEDLHKKNEHKVNPIPCFHVVGRNEYL